MDSRQLEIASRKVIRMLQQKAMPYKWTTLQNDTSYSLEERKQIARFLKKNDYVMEITSMDFILTQKGKEAKSYYGHRFNTWYNALPFVVRHLPAFMMGILLGSMTVWTIVYRCEENAKNDHQTYEQLMKKADSIHTAALQNSPALIE